MTEEKKKLRKEAAVQNKPDSTAILRNMMTMMKAKVVIAMIMRTMSRIIMMRMEMRGVIRKRVKMISREWVFLTRNMITLISMAWA